MNSRVTLGLAGLFLVGAIITGYWGLSLSRQPAPEAVAQSTANAPLAIPQAPLSANDPTRHPVVVLVNDVAPYTPGHPRRCRPGTVAHRPGRQPDQPRPGDWPYPLARPHRRQLAQRRSFEAGTQAVADDPPQSSAPSRSPQTKWS